MTPLRALLLIALALSCFSCIPSIYPLYTNDTLLHLPNMEGDWYSSQDDDAQHWCFEPREDSSFVLKLELSDNDKVSEEEYIVHFLELDGKTYVDFFASNTPDRALTTLIPTHSFARIDFRKDGIYLYQFDYDWLENLFDQRKIRLRHERVNVEWGDIILLTASTRALQQFVRKYGEDEEAYLDPIVLGRNL